MARSTFNIIGADAADADVSALFSFVQGEQLEQTISLQFLPEAFTGYTFEAVVIEANNVIGQTTAPYAIKPGGTQHTLPVRVPIMRGTWSNAAVYNAEDIVKYAGNFYRLVGVSSYSNSVSPASDTKWSLTTKNNIYVQFMSVVGLGWQQEPTPTSPVFGFFELRVTEPVTSQLRRTWKPLRGVVEILYSLTATNAASFNVTLDNLVDLLGGGTTKIFITN